MQCDPLAPPNPHIPDGVAESCRGEVFGDLLIEISILLQKCLAGRGVSVFPQCGILFPPLVSEGRGSVAHAQAQSQ